TATPLTACATRDARKATAKNRLSELARRPPSTPPGPFPEPALTGAPPRARRSARGPRRRARASPRTAAAGASCLDLAVVGPVLARRAAGRGDDPAVTRDREEQRVVGRDDLGLVPRDVDVLDDDAAGRDEVGERPVGRGHGLPPPPARPPAAARPRARQEGRAPA